MKIAVLYGTETGNAEMLAEDVAAHLSGHDCSVTNLSDISPVDLTADSGAPPTQPQPNARSNRQPLAPRDRQPQVRTLLVSVLFVGLTRANHELS